MKVVSHRWSVANNILAFCAALFALCTSATAQQPTKIPRVGFLSGALRSDISTRIEAFRQGLRELRYVEGKNLVIEWRFPDGKVDRLAAVAAELVNLKVDVIVTSGPIATRPAKEATNTIPIIMAQDNDPVSSGFIDSLAKPGGNITGLANLTTELSGKQLETLREVLPKLSHLAVLRDLTEPGNPQAVRETDRASRAFNIERYYLDVRIVTDIEPAFAAVAKKHIEALLVLPSPVFNSSRKQIVDLAAKNRWPGMTMRFSEEANSRSESMKVFFVARSRLRSARAG